MQTKLQRGSSFPRLNIGSINLVKTISFKSKRSSLNLGQVLPITRRGTPIATRLLLISCCQAYRTLRNVIFKQFLALIISFDFFSDVTLQNYGIFYLFFRFSPISPKRKKKEKEDKRNRRPQNKTMDLSRKIRVTLFFASFNKFQAHKGASSKKAWLRICDDLEIII